MAASAWFEIVCLKKVKRRGVYRALRRFRIKTLYAELLR
nr:MAG TPA: hypothetical protein [Caudoviricetes sp.]